jgi:hypothetical protein
VREAFAAIEELKRAKVIGDYAVAGAVGALFYVEPFSTHDVVFLIDLPDSDSLLVSLGPIRSWLRQRGYKEFDEQGNVVIGTWPVQFLPVSGDFSAEALRNAQYLPFDEDLDVRVVRPEYLAAEALRLGRHKDITRVLMLVEAEDFDFDRFSELTARLAWKKNGKGFTRNETIFFGLEPHGTLDLVL